tara:strand:+ start:4899 stop:5432 length:534 start_codon:yes stop_codon:yes gene_type:complete
MKKPRPKTCKVCKEKYQPARPLTEACGVKCAIELAKIKREKKQKKADRERLADLRPLSHWLNETQKVFNEYIRLRDSGEPCISCGTMVTNEWCAGHYRTRGAASQHRFSELNCHKQCNRYCNMELSGNIINYRPRLIEKIGLEAVEALENNNTPKSWTREELEELRKVYRAKIRGMG